MVKRHLLLAALCVGTAAWSGCRTESEAIGNVTGEQSVAPGINESYLTGKVDVDQWIQRFERESREVFAMRNEIVSAAGVWKESTVADIGSGTGVFTGLFAKAVGPKGKVFAVDIVPEFLLHVKQRMADAEITNVETVLCGERSVDLPANTVDLAFMCDVYHHLEYPRATINSLRRAMRPGARLVVIDFKRIPDVSSEWVLSHVRAGQDVVTAEIESFGFEKIDERDFLKENYFLVFRKLE